MYRTQKSRQSNTYNTIKDELEHSKSSLALEIQASQVQNPLFSLATKSIKPLKPKKGFTDINSISFNGDPQLYSKITFVNNDPESNFFRLLNHAYNSRQPKEHTILKPAFSLADVNQPKVMRQYINVFQSHIKSDLNFSISNKTHYKSKEQYLKAFKNLRKSVETSQKPPKERQKNFLSKSFITHPQPLYRKSLSETKIKMPSIQKIPTKLFTQEPLIPSNQKSLIPPVRRSKRDLSLCSWTTDHTPESKHKHANSHLVNNYKFP
ncbi:unnamed protein product [Blepharisma stoltei]|uniref:Uncharacterized protein n=1 Tax=Blepharisma stoltei TaxID=1481888 RepID=A0AAU9IQW8_9CILI|nr:unnamed protein product [Blepharisma stoltei]